MLTKRLETAFGLSTEDNASAFERFANAFLVDDYPELEGVGGKKDKGMDARIVVSESGRTELVVQSCVSPRTAARSKILATVRKLEGNMPHSLIYCTSATIGLALDDTKKELRNQHRVALEVHDAVWFTQRCHTSEGRSKLCETYASEVLQPFLSDVAPERLYSEVLSDAEEAQVIRYLEAHSVDRTRGRNLTKALFDALIMFAMRDSDPPKTLYTADHVRDAICAMFPTGHHARIAQIVPARLQHMVTKDIVKHHQQEQQYALSFEYRQKLSSQLETLQDNELAFRAALKDALIEAIEANEIDYECDVDYLLNLAHNCVLWYMRMQGRHLQNPANNLLSILNTEELASQYLDRGKVKLKHPTTHEVVLDILPSAIFSVIRSADVDLQRYLRSKSDVFIAEAFLQATPDVQKACVKLFGRDVVYCDTSIMIGCVAELYTDDGTRPLLNTLETARRIGIKFKTFRPFVEEFEAHLRGPILLEWQNNFQGKDVNACGSQLEVAPKLIGVFVEWACRNRTTVERIVHDIIGTQNTVQNAIEFLREEFGVETEETPQKTADSDSEEWEDVFGKWLAAKRQLPRMRPKTFELLVRNDVNAYTAIRRLRRDTKVDGANYDHKIWLLTKDRMNWKIPFLLGKGKDFSYQVAMELDYLVNFVATLANMDGSSNDEHVLPATLIVDENEFIPAELRETVAEELDREDARQYLKRRRVRELVQELKTSGREPDSADDIGDEEL